MPFGLPARDEANWDTKLNDSINAIKATADAAQPSATLDASVTAVDANAASALRVQQDARLSATYETFVPVSRHGAVGDGVTNDAAAIQAAIDAVSAAGGGTVYFGVGTFLVGSTLTLHSKVHLRGSGVGATVLRLANGVDADLLRGADFAALTGTNDLAGIYRWSIQSMTLDGNATNNPTSGCGIRVYGYDFRLDDVRIQSFRQVGIYTEWHSNGVPAASHQSMESTLYDVQVTGCGDEGIVWAGPHDSTWHNVIVWSCDLNNVNGRGVWVKTSGNSLNAVNCHVWGGQHEIAWYLEGAASLTDCQGEGAATAQVVLAAGGCRIAGGHYFAAGAAATKGIMIGDATHTGITGSFIDTKVSDCTSGAIDFTNSGGTEVVRVQVYQTSGSARVGTPSFTGSYVQIHVVGGATGAVSTMQGPINMRNGGTAALGISDATTTRFNVDVTNKLIQGVNGGGFIAYSDNYTTQRWKVDGATGVMYVGIGAVQIRAATGSPEGVVTAPVGSLFLRTDGGAGTALYVKESGAGNTGWVAK